MSLGSNAPKANGTFLWVALVFKELQGVKSWNVLQVANEVPTDLVPLYDRMIRQIQQLKHGDDELCRHILSTATLAYRPLHLLELGALSGLPDQISNNIQSALRQWYKPSSRRSSASHLRALCPLFTSLAFVGK
jgi:hypothetical protein